MLRLIIISVLLSSLGFSQNEEIKIAKVEVEGNEVTSKKTIIFTAGLREGQTITTADFPRAGPGACLHGVGVSVRIFAEPFGGYAVRAGGGGWSARYTVLDRHHVKPPVIHRVHYAGGDCGQ